MVRGRNTSPSSMFLIPCGPNTCHSDHAGTQTYAISSCVRVCANAGARGDNLRSSNESLIGSSFQPPHERTSRAPNTRYPHPRESPCFASSGTTTNHQSIAVIQLSYVWRRGTIDTATEEQSIKTEALSF